MTSVSEEARASLRFQRDGLAISPMYRRLLTVVIDDVDRGGPCARVLEQTPSDCDPVFDALPLRFLGGVHRLVLEGRAPELARYYPSAGGAFDPDAPADVDERFLAAVVEHEDELVRALGRGVQTNEVGRCAALLVGFLAVARATGLPLRVLELGASAGLNLRWDRYRYEGGVAGSAWGDPRSPLCFTGAYVDPRPDLDVEAVVVERRGCDRNPIDATTEDGALTLRSFLWPDQLDRFRALDAALAIAGSVPVVIERADAADWVERMLATPARGTATVLYHSIVWQYLVPATRERLRREIERAGRAATLDAPLAWLRMEPGHDPRKSAEVRLRQWPGDREEVVARSGYHGRPVRRVVPSVSPTSP